MERFHFPVRNGKILRNFDFFLPNFHFILPNFYFGPPWRKIIFHRAIWIFLARYIPRLSPPQALSADYHNFMRTSRHQSKQPDRIRSTNTLTFTFFLNTFDPHDGWEGYALTFGAEISNEPDEEYYLYYNNYLCLLDIYESLIAIVKQVLARKP